MSDHAGLRVSQQLGNSYLTRLINQGESAEVYLGERLPSRTPVAIKVFSIHLSREDHENFLREAQAIPQLKHPHILPLLEYGVTDGRPFLMTEYVSTGSLRKRLQTRERPSPLAVLPVVRQIADALHYAHQHQRLHGDIKPENILLPQQDRALLGDFSISLGIQSSRTQNMDKIAGTITYMAPELLQGQPSPASDQYSLGVVLYEWLSGNPPFQGSFQDIVRQQVYTTPPPIRVPAVSTEVETVLLRALAKRPEERFETIQAFASAFEQAVLNVERTFKAQTGWLPPSVYAQLETRAGMKSESQLRSTTGLPPTRPAPPPEFIHTEMAPSHSHKVHRVPTKRVAIMGGILAALLLASVLVAAFAPKWAENQEKAQATATTSAWQITYAEATRGTPLLSDPLQQNVNRWDTFNTASQICAFENQAYHVHALKVYGLGDCSTPAITGANNLVLQVEMTILQGDEGGMMFRTKNPTKTEPFSAYLFSLNRDGTYSLRGAARGYFKTLLHRKSAFATPGLNQKNLLTVIAQGDQITLYINKHYVESIVEESSQAGGISLFTQGLLTPADVAFRNLQVWRL